MTYACTGRCKHCSEGDHTSCGEHIDPQIAADAVRTEGNRLVGIISHVNELKERIDKQIVVVFQQNVRSSYSGAKLMVYVSPLLAL